MMVQVDVLHHKLFHPIPLSQHAVEGSDGTVGWFNAYNGVVYIMECDGLALVTLLKLQSAEIQRIMGYCPVVAGYRRSEISFYP
jgi:hypothetical protein